MDPNAKPIELTVFGHLNFSCAMRSWNHVFLPWLRFVVLRTMSAQYGFQSKTKIKENQKQELKDVACFVSVKLYDNCSIFLVDLAIGKLRSSLDLSMEDYPCAMAFAVHKSMLYMFGGVWMAEHRDDLEAEIGSMAGVTDAYVLDLVELAKCGGSDNEPKPLPRKITEMNAGKHFPVAVEVGNKICVFDTVLGHKPPDCSFELFDPELKTWDKVCDPFHLKIGFFVDRYFVKDDKLFVSIRKNSGIYELDFGASPSPLWHHHDLLYGARTLPFCATRLDFGTLALFFSKAYDFTDERTFAHPMSVEESGKTADEGCEVVVVGNGVILQMGHDKVCTIRVKHLREPDCESRSPTRKKPRTLKPFGKSSIQFVVNICRVDLKSRPIQLTVLESFRIRSGHEEQESCYLSFASLCDA